MPTNFTVVPVEARADGDQDEAAEITEAPGPAEGREPDCSSPGERGRTCPRDKGGAGLRGAGGVPGRGGAPREACGSASPLPGLSRQFLSLCLLLRLPHPSPVPVLPAEPTPSLVAWAPGEGSVPSAPRAGDSPRFSPVARAPGSGKHLILTL